MKTEKVDKVAAWWASMGTEPVSFGHYQVGHPDCDGLTPCSFKPACMAFRQMVTASGGDVDKAKRAIPASMRPRLLWDLMHGRDTRPTADSPRHWAAWRRFLEAFTVMLPKGTLVIPQRDLAIPGELYVSSMAYSRTPLPTNWTIAVRRTGDVRLDVPILKFYPRPITTIEPSVMLRMPLDKWFQRWPTTRTMAARWSEGEMALQSYARRIEPQHIEDFARAIATSMMEGEMIGIPWPLIGVVRAHRPGAAQVRRRRLPDDEIRLIRASSEGDRILAKRFNIARITVRDIRARRQYGDVT